MCLHMFVHMFILMKVWSGGINKMCIVYMYYIGIYYTMILLSRILQNHLAIAIKIQ